MKTFSASVLLVLNLAILNSCSGGGGVASGVDTTTPASKSAVPGRFADFEVNYYTQAPNLVGPLLAWPVIDSALRNSLWQDSGQYLQNAQVTASAFASAEDNVDALFYNGHGNVGSVAFEFNNDPNYTDPNVSYWGVGSIDGAVPPNRVGFPINHRLKWMFFESSDTVAPAPSPQQGYDTSSHWTANWNTAFGGSLHGLYGFWQAPGKCFLAGQADFNRECDFRDDQAVPFAKSLVRSLVAGQGNSPSIIHDAWRNASQDVKYYAGWSSIEDSSAVKDTLSGPTTSGAYATSLSGRLYAFIGVGSQSLGVGIPIPATTFTLSPKTLINESWNDQTEISRAQQYPGVGTVASYDDGQVSTGVSQGGVVALHYYGTTGAEIYHGASEGNPVAFDQPTALAAAQDYVNTTFGMPSDAVLTDVAKELRYDYSSGSEMLVGYTFVWSHANSQIAGGDGIAVTIDDHHYQTRTCSEMTDPDPPLHPKCVSWTITYVDNPNTSYSYRLWRQLGSIQYMQYSGRATGGQSIDAHTASLSLPAGSTIIAYASGYWTGFFNDGASAAKPAWLFTLQGGQIVGVDAFSGQILGSQAL